MNFKNFVASHYPALTSRDFFIFWVGQFISLVGTWMQNTTQPYLAYRISGRPLDLGLIGFAGTLPTLFFALPAGVIIERLDKRKVVIWMQVVEMLQAFVLAFLALTGLVQIWHIIILAFLFGTASAFEITARQAMLIELVGREALPNAIALQSTIFNLARVLGPSLAAPFMVLLGSQGEGWAFLSNGVSYLFVIVGLFFVRTPFQTQITEASKDWIEDFRDGQEYILQNGAISMIVVMAGVTGFIGFPFLQQIPAIAKDLLMHVSDTDIIVAARTSLLYTSQGVGALVASFMIASFNLRRKGRLLLIGQVAFILGLLGIGLIRDANIAFVLIGVIGWGSVSQLAMMNILIQTDVPDNLRGRVFSTYLWALQGVAPFGSLLIGWMAQNWGLAATALVAGSLCLVIIGGLHLFKPELRRREA
ncbi:MAG: MFS transporter [Anaerolineales bacterium]